jgi:hypothetical protein
MATKENGTLVRTDLTRDEYAEIRKAAIDKGQHGRKFCGDLLRRGLPKGGKA